MRGQRQSELDTDDNLNPAPDLDIQPGDLVLRDRGYLTMDEIQMLPPEFPS